MVESDMQVSFPEDVTDRLRAKASQMNLAPEEVVRFIVEMGLDPRPVKSTDNLLSGDANGSANLQAQSFARARSLHR